MDRGRQRPCQNRLNVRIGRLRSTLRHELRSDEQVRLSSVKPITPRSADVDASLREARGLTPFADRARATTLSAALRRAKRLQDGAIGVSGNDINFRSGDGLGGFGARAGVAEHAPGGLVNGSPYFSLSARDQPRFFRNAGRRAAHPSRGAISSCRSLKCSGFSASRPFAGWRDLFRHSRHR